MTVLSESLLPTLICDVFSLSILTYLHFSQVRKPILDTIPTYLLFSWVGKPVLDSIIELPLSSKFFVILGTLL